MPNSFTFNVRKNNEICSVLEASLENYSGDLLCSMPGLEFLIPPYATKEVVRNGKRSKPNSAAILVFNGAEEHIETYEHAHTKLKSLLIGKNFVESLCEPLDIKASELAFNNFEIVGNQEMESLLKKLLTLNEDPVQSTELSLDCLASEVLILALTNYGHTFSDKVQRGLASGHFPSNIDRIKLVLRQHLEDPDFNLDQLALKAGLSKFHMIRIFKEATGTSPAKYLNTVKMDLAKQKLLAGSQSIISMASDLGFRDLSTFNKSFKKATGLSPTQFRKLNA